MLVLLTLARYCNRKGRRFFSMESTQCTMQRSTVFQFTKERCERCFSLELSMLTHTLRRMNGCAALLRASTLCSPCQQPPQSSPANPALQYSTSQLVLAPLSCPTTTTTTSIYATDNKHSFDTSNKIGTTIDAVSVISKLAYHTHSDTSLQQRYSPAPREHQASKQYSDNVGLRCIRSARYGHGRGHAPLRSSTAFPALVTSNDARP